jgi:CheY-like chemotaxis protein
VIEGGVSPRPDAAYSRYRCQKEFEALNEWLRAHGVEEGRPIHTLRKEYGSQVCAKHGIYAASRALRHADIAITSQHYLDKRKSARADLLKALGRLMNSAGFIVEKFNDPATFLAKLQHAPCRVALLDVWMPQMNGLEVQACLRRDSPETRIIFISGRDDPLVRQTALDAGAVAFLAKPFETRILCGSFEKLKKLPQPEKQRSNHFVGKGTPLFLA